MKKLLLTLPFIILLTACSEPEVKPIPKAEPTAMPITHDLIENPGAFKTK